MKVVFIVLVAIIAALCLLALYVVVADEIECRRRWRRQKKERFIQTGRNAYQIFYAD